MIKDNVTTDWIRRYHPAPASRVRLVCFPHAGGSASFYHPVSAAFAGDADVVALQYPGRQDRYRESMIDTIGGLADHVARELRSLSVKPTVFFGHSMGAVLAFETAWRLEQHGAGPRSLILSGRRGPSPTARPENVHSRDDAGLIAEMRSLNGTDAALFDDELIEFALPALRNDFRAVERYVCPPDRVVHCPVAVLVGVDDPTTAESEARDWECRTSGAFELKTFPGGHFYLVDHQKEVIREIARYLGAGG